MNRRLALAVPIALLLVGLGESRVEAVTPTFVRSWGSPASGEGRLYDARGIAHDASGSLYVVDSNGYRVQKYDSSGAFLLRFGSAYSIGGQFASHPVDCSVSPAGDVYVVEGTNNRIHEFTGAGVFVRTWEFVSRIPTLPATFPTCIATDPQGNVYVGHGLENVMKFDSKGNFLMQWGGPGSGDGEFQDVEEATVSPAGIVYVSDRGDRVEAFDNTGAFLGKWGSTGTGDGQFNEPKGIAVDAQNRIYVVDQLNDRIEVFDSNGTFLTKWGSKGSAPGQFQQPWDITVIGESIYVTDLQGVQQFAWTSVPAVGTSWGKVKAAYR